MLSRSRTCPRSRLNVIASREHVGANEGMAPEQQRNLRQSRALTGELRCQRWQPLAWDCLARGERLSLPRSLWNFAAEARMLKSCESPRLLLTMKLEDTRSHCRP